ncbi:MAG TPA: hypothetical protein DCR21_01405 [Succinivibrionaceae bacterium]|nr:hypothetical protein [Succinivibrionaceae bacterium]
MFKKTIMTLAAAALIPQAYSAEAVDCSINHGRIHVEGYGKAEAYPDRAQLVFKSVERNPQSDKALEAVEEKVAMFLSELDNAGIKKEQIIAKSVSLEPEYSYDDKKHIRTVNLYRAQRTVIVQTSDFSKIPEITNMAMQSGLNEIAGFSYEIKDPEKLEREARQNAISDAKEKAELLASGFEVKLSKPCSINFNETGRIYSPNSRNGNMALMAMKAAGPEIPEAEYTQEKITVQSSVSADFAIE